MVDYKKIKVALAPLAGVSDYAFRKICAEHGLKYSVTEMISAKAMHYNDAKTATLAYIHEDESQTAVQLFGSEPDMIAEAAYKLCEGNYAYNKGSLKPCAIDINCGCPVNKIVSNGEGSALMKKPELIGEIVSAAVKAQDLPVTVKIRAGWDKNSINAVEVAKIAEQAGAAMICVHGRTREDMYGAYVNYDIIREVKENVNVPVFANGGIMCADDALSVLALTKADGVMIARGAMGNPWIFNEIASRIDDIEYVKPEISEMIDTVIRQIGYMIADKGEKTAICEARKHIACYTKGLSGSAAVREKINHAETLDEVKSILELLI